MKLKITVIPLTSLIVILCLILELIIYQEISLFQTINLTFIAASPFLIISLFWAVLYSGAFDFFHYSMKKVTAKMRNEENFEEIKGMPLSKSVGRGYQFPLKVGTSLLALSLIGLFIYYFI